MMTTCRAVAANRWRRFRGDLETSGNSFYLSLTVDCGPPCWPYGWEPAEHHNGAARRGKQRACESNEAGGPKS